MRFFHEGQHVPMPDGSVFVAPKHGSYDVFGGKMMLVSAVFYCGMDKGDEDAYRKSWEIHADHLKLGFINETAEQIFARVDRAEQARIP